MALTPSIIAKKVVKKIEAVSPFDVSREKLLKLFNACWKQLNGRDTGFQIKKCLFFTL